MKTRIFFCIFLFWPLFCQAQDYTDKIKKEILNNRMEQFLTDFSNYVINIEKSLDEPYHHLLISNELNEDNKIYINKINKIINLDILNDYIKTKLKQINKNIEDREYEEIIIGKLDNFDIRYTWIWQIVICIITVPFPTLFLTILGPDVMTEGALKTSIALLVMGLLTLNILFILNCAYCRQKNIADEALNTPNILEDNKYLNKREIQIYIQKSVKNFKKDIENYTNKQINNEENKFLLKFKLYYDHYIELEKTVKRHQNQQV